MTLDDCLDKINSTLEKSKIKQYKRILKDMGYIAVWDSYVGWIVV